MGGKRVSALVLPRKQRVKKMPKGEIQSISVSFARLPSISAKTVILEKFDSETFVRCLAEYKIRFAPVVPPVLVLLARTPLLERYDLSHLRMLMSGAAPNSLEVLKSVRKRLPCLMQISQAYGMTEQSLASHLPVYGEATDDHATVGRLMANFEQKIVDLESDEPLPHGKVGEICTRTPTLMLGYFNRPDATRECIDKEGFLHTGDIGYQSAKGRTYVVDRRKELIKVNGMQVAPAELEDVLLGCPGVADAAVTGVPNARTGEVPRAFVVRADASLTAAHVQKYVAERVASYKRLGGGVEFVAEIPKSPSGKILRRQLRDKSRL